MTHNLLLLLLLYLATNTAWSVFIAVASENRTAFSVEAVQGKCYDVKSWLSRETGDQLTAHLFI